MIWPVMHALAASGSSGSNYPLQLERYDMDTNTVSGDFYISTHTRPEDSSSISVRLVLQDGDWSTLKTLSVNGVSLLDDPTVAHELPVGPSTFGFSVQYELEEGQFLSYKLLFENRNGVVLLDPNQEQVIFVTHYEATIPELTISPPSTVHAGSGGFYLYFSRPTQAAATVIVRFSPTEGDYNELAQLELAGVDIHANPDEDFEIFIPAETEQIYVSFDRSSVTTEGSTLSYQIYFSNKPGEPAVFGDEGTSVSVTHQVPEAYEISISPPWSTQFDWSGGEYSLNFNQPIAIDGTITGRLEIQAGAVDFAMANYNTIHPSSGPMDIPLTAGTDRLSVQLNGAYPSRYRLIFENKVGERKILPSAGASFLIRHGTPPEPPSEEEPVVIDLIATDLTHNVDSGVFEITFSQPIPQDTTVTVEYLTLSGPSDNFDSLVVSSTELAGTSGEIDLELFQGETSVEVYFSRKNMTPVQAQLVFRNKFGFPQILHEDGVYIEPNFIA